MHADRIADEIDFVRRQGEESPDRSPRCSEGYYDTFKLPKVAGVCGLCHSTEFKRPPILPYYETKAIVSRVDGMAGGARLPKQKGRGRPRLFLLPLFPPQAKRSARDRARIAPPTMPKPPSIIAQDAGSGTAESETLSSTAVLGKLLSP